MTWNLVASGNASNDDEERALVSELQRVLSEYHAGTVASGFNGETHRGPLHGIEPAGPEPGSQDEGSEQ